MRRDNLSLNDARLAANTKLLAVAHLLAALVTTFVYLSQIDFARFAYWRYGATLAIVLILVPPLFPYLFSYVVSRKLVTSRRLGAWMFVIVLLAVSSFTAALLVGSFGFTISKPLLVVVFIVQTFVYVAAAALLHY